MPKSASLGNLSNKNQTLEKGRKSHDSRVRQRVEPEDTTHRNATRNQDDSELEEEGYRKGGDDQDDVFVVELEKGDSGIGVGLIDGLVRSQNVDRCRIILLSPVK